PPRGACRETAASSGAEHAGKRLHRAARRSAVLPSGMRSFVWPAARAAPLLCLALGGCSGAQDGWGSDVVEGSGPPGRPWPALTTCPPPPGADSPPGAASAPAACAEIAFENRMGATFVLRAVHIDLDGTPLFAKVDPEGQDYLANNRDLTIFAGQMPAG